MTLADLLRETLDVPEQGVWENERTLTPAGVRSAVAFDGVVGTRSCYRLGRTQR